MCPTKECGFLEYYSHAHNSKKPLFKPKNFSIFRNVKVKFQKMPNGRHKFVRIKVLSFLLVYVPFLLFADETSHSLICIDTDFLKVKFSHLSVFNIINI